MIMRQAPLPEEAAPEVPAAAVQAATKNNVP